MSKRLIAFGCSFTFGSALPVEIGSTEENHSHPSQFAYPQIVAYKLNRTCVNMGVGGYSNKAILRRIVEFEYQPDDMVIVMWTVPLRSTIFKPVEVLHESDFFHIQNINDYRDRLFYSLHTEFDLEYTDMMYVLAGVNHLRNQNIKFVNASLGENFWSLKPKWFEPYRPEVSFGPYHVDYALDNSHPGIKSHRKIARQFLTILSS